MKYIKTYEKINIKEPKVGDYVICEEVIPKWGFKTENEDYLKTCNFIATHVGKFVHKIKKNVNDYEEDDIWVKNIYIIEYENVPKELRTFFSENESRVKNKSKETKYYRRTQIDNIKHISKNKEELEAKLNANKYNI